MPQWHTESVEVSSDGGIVTARIMAAAVEERQASAILGAVKAAIEEAGPDLRRLVLDFGEVDFINSSGLAACVELRNGAQARGAATILYRPKQTVDEVFRMVRIDQLYAMARSTEELTRLVS